MSIQEFEELRVQSFNLVAENLNYSVLRLFNDLGKSISFTTQNNLGQEQSYTGEIIKVSKIKNAQGVERRYAIRLKIKLGKKIKSIQINLRNRKNLEYKLLLGRNWLENDYLVDVTK